MPEASDAVVAIEAGDRTAGPPLDPCYRFLDATPGDWHDPEYRTIRMQHLGALLDISLSSFPHQVNILV